MRNDNEIQTLSLLQQIQQGAIDPRDLDKDVRQQIVEVLMLEGSSVSQIAQILKMSDKTIRRDIAVIRERNALSPNIDFAKKLVGDLVMKSEGHRSYLMRLARSQNAKVGERSLAEFYAWKVSTELVEKLQSLGYLPLVPHKIAADIYHHDEDDAKTFCELKDELTVLERVAEQDSILDEQIRERIEFLRLKIDKAQIAYDLNEVKKEEDNEQECK
jgi:transcriptional antiterminator